MRNIGMLAMLIALLASGCGGGQQGTTTTGVEGTTIVIGGVLPLTGEIATYGVSMRNAIQLYFDELNARGGITLADGKAYTVRFVCEDDGSKPEGANNAFRKLIDQDKVFAIIGSLTSNCSLAGAPVAQAAKVVTIAPVSTNVEVTKIGDHIFRACFVDAFQGEVMARYTYAYAGARRAAVIYDNGNDYSKGLAETFRAAFTRLGGEVVAAEAFTDEARTTDYAAQLTSIKAANPDLLFVPCYYTATAHIARQARGLGLTVPLAGCDGWDSPKLAELAGAAIEGGVFSNHYSKDDTRPEVQAFVSAYRAKYGTDPDAMGALGYDAALMLADAIRRAGRADREAARAALAATRDLQTVSGRISLDANRNPVKSAAILRLTGGRQTYLLTVNP